MQLADLGADVLKVESPDGGEPVRSTGPFVEGQSSPFLRLNRGKRSVALDLKSDDGRAAFLALVDRADVLVENLRPGAMRRLGLGYDDLRAPQPAAGLRLGLRVRPGRPARRPPGARHHGPGPRRADEHHRPPGRPAGQGGRAARAT